MKRSPSQTTTRRLRALLTLVLTMFALGLLWPPGPYRTFAQEGAPADLAATYRVNLPLLANGAAPAPDLLFEPAAIELAPGTTASVQVRVNSGADLRGATFDLPTVQEGIVSDFAAAPDGLSGTLTITASTALEADERMLDVQGRSGVDSSKTWVGALKLTTTSTTTAKTIYVDAVNGKDTNSGTQSAPLKTLKKALTKVVSGDTVKLLPGQYNSTHSGDTFPILVPSGVKLVGTLAANGAKQTFLTASSSAAGETGLTFAGDATVKDLELDVFGVAIQASKNTLTLSNLSFFGNRVNVDLKGTAQATLSKANLLLSNGEVGAQVAEQAKLTMDGGKMEGTGSCASERGLWVNDAAQVTLKNSASLQNIHGTALSLNNSSKATLDGATIRQTTTDTCGNIGINVESAAGAPNSVTLAMNNSNVTGFAGSGLRLTGNENVTITGGDINSNKIGIEAGRTDVHPVITITGTTFTSNKTALLVGAPVLKMRRSVVTNNQSGIVVRGVVGFIGGGPAVDLGTDPIIDKSLPSDPGNNDFSGNTNTAVDFSNSTNLFSVSGAWAVGNTWNPNVQGADSNGHYPQRNFITGSSANASGQNFALPTDRKSISL